MRVSLYMQIINGTLVFGIIMTVVFMKNVSRPNRSIRCDNSWMANGTNRPSEAPVSLIYRQISMQLNGTPQELVKEIEANHFLKNARILGHPRPHPGFLTIGIPTMKRPANQTYLWGCLNSLLDNMNATEKNETVIVLLLSDFDENFRASLANSILDKYESELNTGLIQVIEAPREFYPTLENLKRTYFHPSKKVKWRSKQNIDYAFMMKYSANISKYYLQLEDDVTTVPNFIERIKNYMSTWKTWVCLEFSSLGFIGKLFHASDLHKLANTLTLFYEEQPNDVTYLHFNRLMMQRDRRIIKPTIFQHHGFHSTLVIKKSRMKDKYFAEFTNDREIKKQLEENTGVATKPLANEAKEVVTEP